MKCFLTILLFSASVAADEKVYFGADWCSPCRATKPHVLAIGDVTIVDNTDYKNTEYITELGVTTLPTLAIMRDGKIIRKLQGRQSKSAVDKFYANGSSRVMTERVAIQKRIPASHSVTDEWGEYDPFTYGKCVNFSRCRMCQVRAQRKARLTQDRYVTEYVTREKVVPAEKPKQVVQNEDTQASEVLLRLEALAELDLNQESVFVDIGSASGDVVKDAMLRYNCKLGIAVEIDEGLANKARENFKLAGLANRTVVLNIDAKDFEPHRFGITHGFVYLFAKDMPPLVPMLKNIPRLVSPLHAIPGMEGQRKGDCFVYSKDSVLTLW